MSDKLFQVRITASAEADLIDGFEFYELQQLGLGNYFLDSLYSDIDSLCFSAGTHIQYYKQLSRALSRRFPFAIYYRFERRIAYVVAVLDCRQNSKTIRKRLS